MGACLGKPKEGKEGSATADKNSKSPAAPPKDDLFGDEEESAPRGGAPAPEALKKKGVGGKLALFSPFHERKNMVWESPAMSVQGTPLVHLPNFAPAPEQFGGVAANILGAALENAKKSALRGGETRSEEEEEKKKEGGAAAAAGGAQIEKKFGFQRSIGQKYELENEIGRGHFGHTCLARCKKGEMKGKECAVKVIPKANMTSAVAVEDVRREVKILKALGGKGSVIHFYDAFEDQLNVYIATEICEGGELLEQILQRGGRYDEKEARDVMVQILSILAHCHQQGVVHRDLKPENFLFKTKEPNSQLRVIDFGLSDFVPPDQKMNDIVGSAYYIAPEVLHRSYSVEADVWSAGVIAYILLSGARPFWARTESGIFRAVLRMEPNFHDLPWPQISSPAKEFCRWLLTKDFRRRPTAAQALTHPWVRGSSRVPLDMAVVKSLRSFFGFSKLRKIGLRALVPTLTEDELIYLRGQFAFYDANADGIITFDDLKSGLTKVATEAMKESKQMDILKAIDPKRMGKMDFNEFCAAAINVYQLEALLNWPERARVAYHTFIESGHAHVTIEELAKEMEQLEVVANVMVLEEWTNFDGTISFLGFTRLVHGPSRARNRTRQTAQKKSSPSSSARHSHHKTEMNSIPESDKAEASTADSGQQSTMPSHRPSLSSGSKKSFKMDKVVEPDEEAHVPI